MCVACTYRRTVLKRHAARVASGDRICITDCQSGPERLAHRRGLPVHSVEEAVAIGEGGGLNGRAIAIAGYWTDAPAAGCPAPPPNYPPILGSCTSPALTQTVQHLLTVFHSADGQISGSSWSAPQPPFLEPQSQGETQGMESLSDAHARLPRGDLDPLRVIVIGHEDDPRAWQCPNTDRPRCQAIFVVDRVVWVEGSMVDPAPQPRDVKRVQTPGDVEAIIKLNIPGASPLALTAVEASEATSIDPSFRLGIDGIVWIVRITTGAVGPDGTIGLANVAIDDKTGAVLQQLPLPASFPVEPAALRLNGTVGNSAGGSDEPFYELDDLNGAPLLGGYLAWQTPALVLGPGSYVLRGWLAGVDGAVTGKAHDSCHTSVVAEPSALLALAATWPNHSSPCAWSTTLPGR